MKLSEIQVLYVRSMGKALQVTGIFTNDDDTNKFLSKNKDHGVIAQFGEFIFTANCYSKGVQIDRSLDKSEGVQ